MMNGRKAAARAVTLDRVVKNTMAALPERNAFCSSLIEISSFLQNEFRQRRKIFFRLGDLKRDWMGSF
jgi:hypothetical protein